jgi:hypothetical protein
MSLILAEINESDPYNGDPAHRWADVAPPTASGSRVTPTFSSPGTMTPCSASRERKSSDIQAVISTFFRYCAQYFPEVSHSVSLRTT